MIKGITYRELDNILSERYHVKKEITDWNAERKSVKEEFNLTDIEMFDIFEQYTPLGLETRPI